jgi:hypothetical protein
LSVLISKRFCVAMEKEQVSSLAGLLGLSVTQEQGEDFLQMTVVCESRESTSCALKRHTEDEHVQKGIDNGVVVALDQWQVPEEHCRCASKSRAGPHD